MLALPGAFFISTLFAKSKHRQVVPTIMVWEHDKYNGQSRSFTTSNPNLHSERYGNGKVVGDTIDSIMVISGTWQLCEHDGYNGVRLTVHEKGGPDGDGLYPDSSYWKGKGDWISSIRVDKQLE